MWYIFQAGWRISGVITLKVYDIRNNTAKSYKLASKPWKLWLLFIDPFIQLVWLIFENLSLKKHFGAFCSKYGAVHRFLNAEKDTWWWDNILPLIFDCSLDQQDLMCIYYSWCSSSICDPFNNGFGFVVFIRLYWSLSFGWLRINRWSHNSMLIPWAHWIQEYQTILYFIF